MIPHMHKYRFECKTSKYHKHMMSGYTDKMIGIAFFHVHYFRGVTSHNGHNHYYSGITSRPIKQKTVIFIKYPDVRRAMTGISTNT
jgi:hypothetical protein